MSSLKFLTVAVAVACIFLTSAAHAATIEAKFKQNGAGACQGALPAFAGTLRARPLALQNEGTTDAFVTCSLPFDDDNGEGATEINAVFQNTTGAAITTSCTLVDGSLRIGTPYYVVKSVSIGANGTAELTFLANDYANPSTLITRPNLSCQLPSGLGLAYVYFYGPRQIGN